MIKLVGVAKNGNPAIILGLSAENLKNLMDGKPILAELSFATISVFYGETEQSMIRDLIEAGVVVSERPNSK